MLRVRFLPPTNLFAWTALTPTHMPPLVERMWARHPDAGRGRPWRLGFADRVLLVALAYRTNLTERQLAVLFGVAPSVAHRVIADLAPALAALLGPPPADRRHLWVVDGTLIPVHDQPRTAKSRNNRRSVHVQVVVRRRDRRVVAVGHAWPGNRNDVAVWKGCGVAGHGRHRPRPADW
jgi:Helix-turn-helix of DDE superfamily endonuclease